jgi:hypothetical protein
MNLSQLDASDLIALYAAILSTLLAVWTIYREVAKDRRRIRATAMYGDLRTDDRPIDDSSQTRWLIQVTNVGQTSVVLASAAYADEDGAITVLAPLRNSKLEPGNSLHFGPGPGPARQKVKKLWVEDTVGKRHFVHRIEPLDGRVIPLGNPVAPNP